ncbi:MAG: Guanylate kinase [Chlamydiia bacterium]|nr:Guanylate kinase [Chlamydiia bacterium]MCH9615942.1 Guanylate kinase [Chlamydiia bacterium]MCH9628655.1 Guanylate kinase [Chlamydiia bacterium]
MLLGNHKNGIAFVISAPAGTGKTTLAKMLYKEFKGVVVPSVSCTTRKPREGEVDGVDYFFLTREVFEKKLAAGEFLEHADVFGEYYGTLHSVVEDQLMEGKHVVMVIDTQGALQIREAIESTLIFITPPSLSELKKRLSGRGSETEESLQKRLSWAAEEIEKSKNYDYLLVNDDLEIAYSVLKSILVGEEHRRIRWDLSRMNS